jgi:polyadenylation factor subunit 2
MSTLPVLLPASVLPKTSTTAHLDWKPNRYLSEPQPPPQDENRILEAELANARQMIDGKLIKKTRPRRTVDYNGGMGRWLLVCCRVNRLVLEESEIVTDAKA